MSEKRRYYHGGKRGLKVGDHILPPSITGARGASDFADMGGRYRKDRVYVTTELNTAKFFATGNSALAEPAVYEVEPVGDLEEDPDRKEPGLSFACEKAIIISVRKIAGKDIKKQRKLIIKNIHREKQAAR